MADRAPAADAAATVSSLKSEDSTEQLICKTPQKLTKSVVAKSDVGGGRRRVVVALGLAQAALGALLVGAGAAALARGAALARAGAGLWAGGVAVVAGVVGVLAGVNDCYALSAAPDGSSGMLTAFLALSLLALACGNGAAVLAATGLQRDATRAPPSPVPTFEEEMKAWNPVLANIAVLIVASAQCAVCVASVCAVSRRVCPCLRARRPYDHNTFEAAPPPTQPPPPAPARLLRVEEARDKRGQLARNMEGKLHETLKKKKEEPGEFGSATSRERLVSRWLGAGGGRRHPPPPLVLLPAPSHAATLGRVPVSVVVPQRYATLPLPPAPYPPPARLFYPVHDPRVRRRVSRRGRRGERRRRDERERGRDSKLARSLERIHRRRRNDRARPDDEDLRRTYTGLDRTYAEQYIAVCDESRHAAEAHDSLASTSTSSDTAPSHATT